MPMTVRYTVINGEVVAEKRNDVRLLYTPDPLGSTVALTDNTQTITDTFHYWPYGEESGRTGATPTPFRFVGASGFYRDNASRSIVTDRCLDQLHGRWSSPSNTNATPINRYSFGSPTVAPIVVVPHGLLANMQGRAADVKDQRGQRKPKPDDRFRQCIQNCNRDFRDRWKVCELKVCSIVYP